LAWRYSLYCYSVRVGTEAVKRIKARTTIDNVLSQVRGYGHREQVLKDLVIDAAYQIAKVVEPKEWADMPKATTIVELDFVVTDQAFVDKLALFLEYYVSLGRTDGWAADQAKELLDEVKR